MSNYGYVRRRVQKGDKLSGKFLLPKAATKTSTALFQMQNSRKQSVNGKNLFERVWPDVEDKPCMTGEWVAQARERVLRQSPSVHKPAQERRKKRGGTSRHCKDCGTPTNDYRCQICWKILLGGEYEATDQVDMGVSCAFSGVTTTT